MVLFGLSRMIVGIWILIDPNSMINQLINLTDEMKENDLFIDYLNAIFLPSGIAATVSGVYYISLASNKIYQFFRITIIFRLFVTVPIMIYIAINYDLEAFISGAIWDAVGALVTFVAFKYDEKQYIPISQGHESFLSKFIGKEATYQININFDSKEKDKIWQVLTNFQLIPKINPKVTSVIVDDITSLAQSSDIDQIMNINGKKVDHDDEDHDSNINSRYYRLRLRDEFEGCFGLKKWKMDYVALFEVIENNNTNVKKVIGYAYAWPDFFIINVFTLKDTQLVQTTYISSPPMLANLSIKTAKEAHVEALNKIKFLALQDTN